MTRTRSPEARETPSTVCSPESVMFAVVDALTLCLKSRAFTEEFSLYEPAMLLFISPPPENPVPFRGWDEWR